MRGRPRKLRRVEIVFWRLWRLGWDLQECSEAAGVSVTVAKGWLRQRGGLEPRLVVDPEVDVPAMVGARGLRVRSQDLTVRERGLIADLVRQVDERGRALTAAEIGRRLGRHRSTIGRELARNSSRRRAPRADVGGERGRGRGSGLERRSGPGKGGNHVPAEQGRGDYYADYAQVQAETRRARPKIPKLVASPALAAQVQAWMSDEPGQVPGPDEGSFWSPRMVSAKLKARYPNRPEMQVSHEALYASVYRSAFDSVFVQGRGGLRADLHRCLRTGRARRVPNARSRASSERVRTRIPGLVSISERPAEVEDRALPGHWEGDLIIGKDSQSAVATLVERTTRYLMLLPLPRPADPDGYSGSTGRGAEAVRDAIITAIGALPKHLWQSLTWDRGIEMARHFQITDATDVAVYFCDPHSPWQRGSNENTNGLVRQYLPKGTDLAVHSARDLEVISIKLNGRPRQTLGWKTPAEALNELLSRPYDHDGVAGTA